MIDRTLSVASAAILGLLTFIVVNVLSDTLARAADDCRSSPGAEAPAGGHWRYRLEKGTGRKCWYLAGLSSEASVAETKPADTPKAASALPKPKSPEIQPGVADAHAELTKPDSSRLTETSVWPPLSTPPVDAVNSQTTADQNPQQNITLAQRWPEPNSVRTSDNEFAEQMRVAANNPAPTATPVPPAPLPPLEPHEDSTLSPMRILLVAIIGALALVGVLLRTILGYLAKRRKLNTPRRQIWTDATNEQLARPYAQRSHPMRPAQHARLPRPLYDDREAQEEIELLLRRASLRDQR